MKIAIEHLNLDELKSFLREQAEDAFPDLKDAARLNMLAEKWHDFAEFCTCREDSGRLVGMIAFYANRQDCDVAYIPHVYISMKYRGTGTFTSMLNQVTNYVYENGFGHVRLEVHKDNIRAQKAYLNNGFQIDGNDSDKSIYMKYTIDKYDRV